MADGGLESTHYLVLYFFFKPNIPSEIEPSVAIGLVALKNGLLMIVIGNIMCVLAYIHIFTFFFLLLYASS